MSESRNVVAHVARRMSHVPHARRHLAHAQNFNFQNPGLFWAGGWGIIVPVKLQQKGKTGYKLIERGDDEVTGIATTFEEKDE